MWFTGPKSSHLYHVTRFPRKLHKVKKASFDKLFFHLPDLKGTHCRSVLSRLLGCISLPLFLLWALLVHPQLAGLLYFLYLNPHFWPLVSLYLTWGPFLETPDNFPGPVSIFSKLIYLSANGNYWHKLSEMLHEIITTKI